MNGFDSVEEALEELRNGKIILVTDDPDHQLCFFFFFQLNDKNSEHTDKQYINKIPDYFFSDKRPGKFYIFHIINETIYEILS